MVLRGSLWHAKDDVRCQISLLVPDWSREEYQFREQIGPLLEVEEQAHDVSVTYSTAAYNGFGLICPCTTQL